MSVHDPVRLLGIDSPATPGGGRVIDTPRSQPAGATVSISGVYKEFDSRDGVVPVLDDISLDVAADEFVSIVGPSGCGKSTLLLLVAGLVPFDEGTIHVSGRPVDKAHTDLGIVFQDANLLDWLNVLDNIMIQVKIRRLDRQVYRARATELLKRVGLTEFEKKHPYQLSGGMRQRVAICRSLVHDPPLLLMDEPFGALDALTRDQLNADLQSIWQTSRKTVIFITHSIPEAVFLSDRVVVMSRRPARIQSIIPVDLPRPRDLAIRETPEFASYVRQIRTIFEAQGVLPRASLAAGVVGMD